MESCAFTGHRNLDERFSLLSLKEAIDECIDEGCTTFYCGMARGFDLIAAEEIVERKKKDTRLKLVACVPFRDQGKNFFKEERDKYEYIISLADEVVVLYDQYTPWCMAKRNEYMADRADMLIAYCEDETGKGGTAYTVKYFKKKKGGKIVNLAK